MGDIWNLRMKANPKASLRMFCCHYAGSSAAVFRNMISHLSHNIEVLAIQLPGRDNRFNEKYETNMRSLIIQLCDSLNKYFDKPIIFFGYSLGALICFEVIRELRRRGRNNIIHLIACACQAPHIEQGKKPLLNQNNDDLIRKLKCYNGTSNVVLNNDELLDILLPRFNADFCLYNNYQYYDERPLNIPISVLGGKTDPIVHITDLFEWQVHTKNQLDVHIINGDHFFIHTNLDSVTKILDKIFAASS